MAPLARRRTKFPISKCTSPNENFEYIYPLNDIILSYFLLLLYLFKFDVICVRFSSAFITLGERASCVLCRGISWSYSRFVFTRKSFRNVYLSIPELPASTIVVTPRDKQVSSGLTPRGVAYS